VAQQTQINGNRYSFTNITISTVNYAFGQAVLGGGLDQPRGVFKSINYDAMLDPGLVQGNQVTPVGRTQGYGSSTGSFEMLLSELDDFYEDLTFGGQFPIMGVDFDIIVQYSVNDVDVRIDLLRGCRITKLGSANQQGNDASTGTCELSIMQIQKNGIDAYADPAF